MVTIYEIGPNGIWTGVSKEIGEGDPAFDPWTRAPVPSLAPGEYALIDGFTWRVVTELPRAPVPEEISDRQFFHALALLEMITEAEALAAVKTGDPPAAMEAFLAALPVEDQFNARMLLEGAVTFRRSHPLTAAFAAGMSMSAEQTDDLWRMAAAL